MPAVREPAEQFSVSYLLDPQSKQARCLRSQDGAPKCLTWCICWQGLITDLQEGRAMIGVMPASDDYC